MAEITPKNSTCDQLPPEQDSDSSSDEDIGPKSIPSLHNQTKLRASILSANFDPPGGTGEQVLGHVMDPVSPTHTLFNIVAVSYSII